MFLPLPLLLAAFLQWSPASAAGQDPDFYYKRMMYDFGLGKRAAYTYSANKRPMYNFGIGKRDSSKQQQRMYAFGLGKRSDEIEDDLLHAEYSKRLKPYEFGLGKRAGPTQGKLYSFGLGKRWPYTSSQDEYDQYDQPEEQTDKRSRYSFGLGKRSTYWDNERAQRSQRYGFGLGKRNYDYTSPVDDSGDYHDVFTRASQKYAFGLGKREVSKEALEQLQNNLMYAYSPMRTEDGDELEDAEGETSGSVATSESQHQHNSSTVKREIQGDKKEDQQRSVQH